MERFNEVRFRIALPLAGVGTAVYLIGYILSAVTDVSLFGAIGTIGMLIGWVSYLFGGLLSALKIAWKITVLPFQFLVGLPVLFLCVFTFGIALVVILFLPIIPVYMSWRDSGTLL